MPSLKSLYMFTAIGLIIIAIIGVVEQGEYWVPDLLRNIFLANGAWVIYYDLKTDGVLARKRRIQKAEEQRYLKSYLLLLYGITTTFLLIFFREIVLLQNRGVVVLITLGAALIYTLLCLYKVIRIMITAPKTQ